MLGVLALALVGYQNLFSLSSNNNGMNEVPFVGLILAFVVEVFLIVKESGKEPNGWDGIGRNWIIGILIFALVITALIWPKTKNLNLVIGVVAGLLIAWFSGRWQKAESGITSGPGHARSCALRRVLVDAHGSGRAWHNGELPTPGSRHFQQQDEIRKVRNYSGPSRPVLGRRSRIRRCTRQLV